MSTYQIASAMILYGGSFVSKLGEALLCADSENVAKIKATWPEYWNQYASLVEHEHFKVEEQE